MICRYRQILVMLACLHVAATAWANVAAFDTAMLLEQAVTERVRVSADGAAIVLDRGELIEDDGPAAGYSYKPNEERLSSDVRIKKDLYIPDPRTSGATLLIGGSGTLQAIVNGKPVALNGTAKAGNYWRAFALPPKVLQAGKNEVVLHGSGKIWIARDDEYAAGSLDRTRHPNRSARSTDGGRTWDYDRLGPDGKIDGEYYVRVFLDRHHANGTITLPVVDAGNLAGQLFPDPITAIDSVRITADAIAGRAGRVLLRARSGPTLRPDETWSPWQEVPTGDLKNLRGRFVQVAVDLSTLDPLQTPAVKKVLISATCKTAGDWPRRLRVTASHNERIVRSLIPFEHERFDHPSLKELRQRHQLDKIVGDARNEFEMICRLAVWASKQWEHGHLAEAYPPWDALKILKPHHDGKPIGGFCQQYNIVFLQACQSFGIAGRAVSLSPGALVDKPRRSGHEVVELWSNDHRKWVYVDGQFAWYAVDADTNVPLSLWELRRRQLETLNVVPQSQPARSTKIVKLSDAMADRNDWTGLNHGVPFAELRLIPRSNFLQATAPLPLNQGMRGWFWTGHYVWTDDDLPAAQLYSHRVVSRQDWEWTLNQARYALEATATPGEFKVHLDTETPSFATFLAAIDDGQKQPVASGFTWKLHPGRNRLKVRPKNIAGVEGISSWIEVDQR